MTSCEIISARIERIAAGGAGIASANGETGGKRVFVEFTAPGDLVSCRIKKDHKTWAEAEIVEILEPSPERIEPLCPHYGRCGGCTFQHLDYEAQIKAKTAILRETFSRIGGIAQNEIRLRKAAPFEYRNRMAFHKTNGNHPGFKERKSGRLVVIEDCPIAECGIRKALREGKLLPPPGKERFSVFSCKKTFLCEGGTEKGRVSVLDRELAMDVRVFFQSNIAMLELLVGDLIAAASNADRALPLADIYCGVGTFASILLSAELQGNSGFSEIDLVEENKNALTLARENMPPDKKINYYAISDTDWSKTQKKGRAWGFMVLDPPRKGLSLSMREFLVRSGPELAAYVSCDPATLARDSSFLLRGGYTLKELTMYDFYPQTAHIETLAVFCREKK
jgi:23S rRNA (uracil1939-C5)-methyltransferase